jgi:hypothetical protein
MPNKLKRFESTKIKTIKTNTSSALKFKKLSLMMVTVYLLYLGKSALGINLSDKYTVPQLFKAPFVAMDCILPIEGNYCYKSKKKALVKS